MDFELYINWGVVGIIVLIALVIALLAANIKVVPQAHAFVIERLGAYHVSAGVPSISDFKTSSSVETLEAASLYAMER